MSCTSCPCNGPVDVTSARVQLPASSVAVKLCASLSRRQSFAMGCGRPIAQAPMRQ